MKLVLVSQNKGKIAEMSALLAPLGFELSGLSDIGFCGDIEETGSTFIENALIKAHAIADKFGLAAIADDSGLCVNALFGQPGVYSARYGGSLCTTDAERTALLLRNMEGVTDRSAYFVSAVACVLPDGREICAEGRVNGEIAHAASGEGGFGYDPVFIYNGRTFADMTSDEKNLISHRSRSLSAFYDKLKEANL